MLIRITKSAQTNIPLSINALPTIILPSTGTVDLAQFAAYEPKEILSALNDSHVEYEIVAAEAEAEDGASRGVEEAPSSITDERRDELLKLLDGTVAEVEAKLPDLTADERALLLAAEQSGKTRSTLISAFEALNA
jgi:hypothetical protein